MTLWMPNKKKPLYAPMLATFGGGSVRGFGGGGAVLASGGGGGTNGLGGSWDYTNETEYTFDGTQTSPVNLSSAVSFGNVSNFDVEFDISCDRDYSDNQWFLTNGNYSIDGGLLFGVWNSGGNEGIAIAGGNIGAYGNQPYANIPDETYITISAEFRLSVTQSNNTIKIYHNGILQGTQSNVPEDTINLNYLYVGMGSSNGTFANPLPWNSSGIKGSIKNISIREIS
jgi:hypothetical protein